ncbi:MAG: hypothetical protein Kow0065_05260 [Methylomicrobium sp.]
MRPSGLSTLPHPAPFDRQGQQLQNGFIIESTEAKQTFRNRLIDRTLAFTLKVGCLILVLGCPAHAADEDIVAIVHPSVIPQQLSIHTVKQIFGMKLRQWPNDKPIKVFVLPDRDPVHINFVKRILQIFPSQLRLAWDRQVFSGTGQAPSEANSEDDMLIRVSSTPGAIGYVSRPKADLMKIRIIEVH